MIAEASVRNRPSRTNLPALTGLRFLAAGLVVLLHAEVARNPMAPDWLRSLAANGNIGVGIFFVLSGFILSHNYSVRDVSTEAGVRSFRWARVARIYPVYALGLLLTLPVFLEQNRGAPGWACAVAGAMVLALLHAWIPSFALLWNFPSWSLSDEAFFYAVFPRLRPATATMGPRLAALCLVAAWLASLAPVALLLLLAATSWPSLGAHDGLLLLVLKYNPLLRLPEFVAGMALHRVYETIDDRRKSRSSGGLLSSVAILGLFSVLAFSDSYRVMELRPPGLLLPFIAPLILGLAIGGGPLYWLLSRPVMQILGEASYALYILHAPVLRALNSLNSFFRESSPHTWRFESTATAVAVVAAVATFYGIEQPARRWLRSRVPQS